MKIEPTGIAGVTLLARGSEEFEAALQSLLGRAPRELIAPAVPYSVIVVNDSSRTISLLGVRFDMLTPHAVPCSVVHYSDTLRNPEKSDFQPGVKRFVCAEPSFTALLLRRDGDLSSRGRNNLDNLRRMLNVSARVDCVAWSDGKFEGPDTLGGFERLARQRLMEEAFVALVQSMDARAMERLLKQASEDTEDRARRKLGRKLLEGFQSGGPEEVLKRARNHCLKIPLHR
jgi:hypothetical protein